MTPCPRLSATLVALVLSASAALAHEFWIEPARYQVETGGALVAHLKNGQEFVGIDQALFQGRIERFELIQDGRMMEVTGRMGDIPALDMTAPGQDGLVIILHQTTKSRVTYREWEKFAAFANHKDFPDIRARHMARGLPESGFTELYARFAKALVAVGDGAGQDAVTGMETEIVALANPYADDLSAGLPVKVLYQGQPRAQAQVEVFTRAPDGTVTITYHRTDDAGMVTVPVDEGHEYLLDAVVLREAPQDSGAAWETLWAALTFAVP